MSETGKPCDCPAVTYGLHQVSEHDQDCGGVGAENRCANCWGCIADQVAYHQVIASRGGAA